MIERFIASHLQRLAGQYPVITLTGPRQAGKTTICKAIFPDYDYVNLENLTTRSHAIEDPSGFLAQFPDGVILDEIQRAPELTSYIQTIVDELNQPGQFILTGSQQFEVTDVINQSLAGRTAVLKLMPFAYNELYDAKQPPALEDILYTGFYPRIYDKDLVPTEALSFYLSTYIERDLRSLINIRDLSAFERFLKICASQIGQLVNYSRLANDCGINQNTVKSWLSLLKASYIIYEIQPHFRNFRKRLTKSAKLYFCDVGLAAYLLGITRAEHVNSHPLKGTLFENFIVSEFVKNRYNNVQDSNLYFFRDHIGNEVDLILDYGQQLLSVEIKSGVTINSDAFKGLDYYHKLGTKYNTARFLVYAGNKSYQRQEVQIFSYKELKQLFAILPP
jgi:predicted AAA+ superfamily ATPase